MVETPTVMIMWMEETRDGPTYNTVAWFGGHGPIRTYRKDCYDGRLTMGQRSLPYFDDSDKAVRFMWQNRGLPGMCQVDLSIVHELDYSPNEFDQDDIAHHGMKTLKGKLVYV